MNRTALRIALVAGLLVLVYALLGFLLAPRLVERYLPQFASDRLGLQASVEQTRFNPFLLTFEATGVRLGAPGVEPIARLERLFIDLESASVFKRAWTFASVRLDGPSVRLEIGPDGRWNLPRLAQRQGDAGAPARVLLQHASVDNGRLTLLDRRGSTTAGATLEAVHIELSDVGTLADLAGRYSATAALQGGGGFKAEGTLALEPMTSTGQVTLSALPVTTAWPFLFKDGVVEAAGTLAASTRYDLSGAALRLDELALQLADASLRARDSKEPMLALQAFEAKGGRFDAASGELVFAEATARNGSVVAGVDREGRLNWQQLAPPAAPGADERSPPPAAEAAPAPRPWQLTVESLGLQNIAVRASDHHRPRPLAVEVGALAAKGRLSVAAAGGSTRTQLTGLSSTLERAVLKEPGAAEPLASLTSIAVAQGSVDTAARTLRADSLSVQGGHVPLVRAGQGGIELLRALGLGAGATPADAPAPAAGTSNAARSAWNVALGSASVQDLRLSYADRTQEPAVVVEADASARVGPIDSASTAPMPFDVALRMAGGGTLGLSGTAAPGGASADATLTVSRVPMLPLRPLLARHAAIDLRAGVLSATAQLSFESKDQAPRLRAKGEFSVADLLLNEAGSGDRILSWKALAAQGVTFDSAARRLAIQDVQVQQPGLKLVIHENRQVNLAQLIKRPPADRAAAAVPARSAAAATPPFQLQIERIGLRNGIVDFADLSLVLPFGTRITAIDGSIAGVSTAPGRRAQVKASGEVPPYGAASVEGALVATDPKQFLDLKVVLQNVEVPPLSPYSATFAGRKIASGKLWLELEYKIAQGQLLGDNRIRLADFKLGERVEGARVLDVPLDLAIALLTDERGRIDLAVPVRGDIGRPEVDVGTLVREALGQVLQRIVSAPFRALGRLFGGSEESSVRIRFVPGRAELLAPEREKLQKVSEGLQQRPQLRLVVPAPYAPEADGRALRAEVARAELFALLGRPPAKDGEPAPLVFGDPQTQQAVERLLAKVEGTQAPQGSPAGAVRPAATSAQDAARPVAAAAENDAGEGRYRALFERVVERLPLPPSALQALAAERSAAIRDFLARSAGVPADRVQAGDVRAVSEPPERFGATVAAPLKLDVAK